jgi:oligopeptide/dipeptide ABC transporter ATP-binding protein
VRRGEILALVGESGSGKTTLGRCLLGLTRPSAGRIVFHEQDLATLRGDSLRGFRRRVQPVFQNPYSSLDPRWSIERTVREGLDAFSIGSRAERRARVGEVLEDVGLTERHGHARPHELSGGQRQRAAIAAALATRPEVIVADEPVSALDVLVQAQILNLIARLQHEHGLTIVLITHDFGVVEHLADRVAVMYLGRIVEVGPADAVLAEPAHPYTRALIESIPQVAAGQADESERLGGEIPSAVAPPAGCAFHPRCPLAFDRCPTELPPLLEAAPGRLAACHLVQGGSA